MRAAVIVVIAACGSAEDPLIPATTPAIARIGAADFTIGSAALIENPTYGTRLELYEEKLVIRCNPQAFDDIAMRGFQLGLGKASIAAGVEIVQLGRDPDDPGKDGWIGKRYANYYRPNRDGHGLASLGYGGGSYRVQLDQVTGDTVTGKVAIGRFDFDDAKATGKFTATRCR